jgi:hypothetical protein
MKKESGRELQVSRDGIIKRVRTVHGKRHTEVHVDLSKIVRVSAPDDAEIQSFLSDLRSITGKEYLPYRRR